MLACVCLFTNIHLWHSYELVKGLSFEFLDLSPIVNNASGWFSSSTKSFFDLYHSLWLCSCRLKHALLFVAKVAIKGGNAIQVGSSSCDDQNSSKYQYF